MRAPFQWFNKKQHKNHTINRKVWPIANYHWYFAATAMNTGDNDNNNHDNDSNINIDNRRKTTTTTTTVFGVLHIECNVKFRTYLYVSMATVEMYVCIYLVLGESSSVLPSKLRSKTTTWKTINDDEWRWRWMQSIE